MPHMMPEIEEHTMTTLEDDEGVNYVPLAYLTARARQKMRTVRGYFHRLSAPGYLDCTDWIGPFESLELARADFIETYSVCPDCGEDIGESYCPCFETRAEWEAK